MESDGTKMKSPSERRFGSIIFLLRLAGIPFQMKKISTIYAIYMTTLIFCGFTTYIGLLFDGYVHLDDLERTMTSMRMLIPFTNIMWLYTYCRYVRTLTIIVRAAQILFSKHSIAVIVIIKTKRSVLKKI